MTVATPISTDGHAKPVDYQKQHQLLIKHTQKWIAQTFYGQMLQQMRKSPFKDDMLSGGRGGEAFGEMLDQQLADRISRSSGSKLVNAIVDKIEYARNQRSGKTLMQRRRPHGITPTRSIDLKV